MTMDQARATMYLKLINNEDSIGAGVNLNAILYVIQPTKILKRIKCKFTIHRIYFKPCKMTPHKCIIGQPLRRRLLSLKILQQIAHIQYCH